MLQRLEEELRQAGSPRHKYGRGSPPVLHPSPRKEKGPVLAAAVTSAELTFGNATEFTPRQITPISERQTTPRMHRGAPPIPLHDLSREQSSPMVWKHGVALATQNMSIGEPANRMGDGSQMRFTASPSPRPEHKSPRRATQSPRLPDRFARRSHGTVTPTKGELDRSKSADKAASRSSSPRQPSTHPASLPPRFLKGPESISPRKSGPQLRQEVLNLSMQGPLVLLGTGHFDRLPAVGSQEWIERSILWEHARRKLKRLLSEPSRFTVMTNIFTYYAPVNVVNGIPLDCVTGMQFEDGLRRAEAKLSLEEIREVVRRADETKSNRIKYAEFLSNIRSSVAEPEVLKYMPAGSNGQVSAQSATATVTTEPNPNLKGGSTKQTEESPERQPLGYAVKFSDKKDRIVRSMKKQCTPAFVVFLLGWIVFPVWCLGWLWCKAGTHQSKVRRMEVCCISPCPPASFRLCLDFCLMLLLWGKVSLALACIWTVVGASVGVVLSLTSVQYQKIDVAHCPSSQGVVAAIKAIGPSASEDFFWNRTGGISDYSYQIRLKAAISDLCAKETSGILTFQDCTVELDEIKNYFDDSVGSILVIAFKLVTTTLPGAETILPLLSKWIQSGMLQRALAARGILFDSLNFMDSAPSFKTGPAQNPSLFQQSRVTWNNGLPTWRAVRSSGLMRQSPTAQTSNVMDPNDKEWAVYRLPYLRTCWMVNLIQVLAVDVSSTEQRAKRTLQIVLRTNQSSSEIFQLWARMAPSDAVFNLPELPLSQVPVPTWLMDSSPGSSKRAVQGQATRDVANCAVNTVNDLITCPIYYSIEMEVDWTGRSYCWVGVTGQSAEAQYVPFELLTRLQVV